MSKGKQVSAERLSARDFVGVRIIGHILCNRQVTESLNASKAKDVMNLCLYKAFRQVTALLNLITTLIIHPEYTKDRT